MKNILLPTDFSEHAFNAIRYAVQLFKNEKCTFYLLNTYSPVIYDTDYSTRNSRIADPDEIHRRKSLPDLRKTQTQIKREFPNDKHIFKVVSSSKLLTEEVQQQVTENEIDLVIMGTQGATGAKQILFGSQTVDVINNTLCPVLAIPSYFDFKEPANILFPTDLTAEYLGMKIKILKHISLLFSSRIYILHVLENEELTEDQEKQKNVLARELEGIAHEFHIQKKNNLSEAIEKFQNEYSVDILVMINNKHSFFENLLRSPIIKKIGFLTKIPFLVIPPEK